MARRIHIALPYSPHPVRQRDHRCPAIRLRRAFQRDQLTGSEWFSCRRANREQGNEHCVVAVATLHQTTMR